jgi:hypothetical protein
MKRGWTEHDEAIGSGHVKFLRQPDGNRAHSFEKLYRKKFILGTLKKASAAAFQGTGSDPL